MMPPSACQQWPADSTGQTAGKRSDPAASYTTPGDVILCSHAPKVIWDVKRWIVATLIGAATPAGAMQINVSGDQIILSGPVVWSDAADVALTLADNPAVTTAILRNSPGGDANSGYAIGEIFRAKAMRTAVSGFCYSSCSRMFIGGRTRVFTSDFPPDQTHVGFHGHYNADGTLNAGMVRSLHLRDWIIKFSDGKADASLVDQWVNIPVNLAMIHFYHPTALRGHPVTTFFCHDANTKVFDCEPIAKTALDVGVITSLDLIASHDVRD